MPEKRKRGEFLSQLPVHLMLLAVTAIVMFPVLWVVSMSIDSRNIDKPLTLTLIPPGANLRAFQKILTEPFQLLCADPLDVASCMTFAKLLKNSLMMALGTSLFAVVMGASAAYAFSRFKFIGRQAGLLGFIVLLMLPSTATLAPLYVLLSSIQFRVPPLPLAGYAVLLGLYGWGLYAAWRYDARDKPRWYGWLRWGALAAFAVLTALNLILSIGQIRSNLPGHIAPAALTAAGCVLSALLLYVIIPRLAVEPLDRTARWLLGAALATSVVALLLLVVPTFGLESRKESLRSTLLGLAIAYTSGALPFAIWNLKGYFDTVPKELEEAALIDGASVTQTFIRIIVPLSVPALAVTVLFSFMTGWTEFILAWIFLEQPSRFTLAMALRSMQGQFSTPWSEFSAMSIVMSIPILVLFFLLQRYIVSGLTVGGVKG